MAVGNKVFYGGVSNKVFYGGVSNKVFYGGVSNKVLYGGVGNKVFYGSVSNKVLYGGVSALWRCVSIPGRHPGLRHRLAAHQRVRCRSCRRRGRRSPFPGDPRGVAAAAAAAGPRADRSHNPEGPGLHTQQRSN